jgi:outer membrane lipoprotein carrier protein
MIFAKAGVSLPSPARRERGGGEGCRRAARIAALLLFFNAAQANPIDQLHQFLSQTTTARGDFTQTSPGTPAGNPQRPSAAPPAPVVSRGSFEFQRPGRFRWTYRTPYEQLIVSDGTNLYLYDKDLQQVTRRDLHGALPASPASILFGSNDFERDFQVSADGAGDGIEWIRATPRTQDSVFELIRIGFSGGLPVAMELRDSFGQSTRLSFEHLQRNPALAAGLFSFTPPPGVDVLEDK